MDVCCASRPVNNGGWEEPRCNGRAAPLLYGPPSPRLPLAAYSARPRDAAGCTGGCSKCILGSQEPAWKITVAPIYCRFRDRVRCCYPCISSLGRSAPELMQESRIRIQPFPMNALRDTRVSSLLYPISHRIHILHRILRCVRARRTRARLQDAHVRDSAQQAPQRQRPLPPHPRAAVAAARFAAR